MKYGTKTACAGAWKLPVPKSQRIDSVVQGYYARLKQQGRRIPHANAGFRGECEECGKLCALRSNGTVGSHVDNRRPPPSPEKRERQEHRLRIAQDDLLKLRAELKES